MNHLFMLALRSPEYEWLAPNLDDLASLGIDAGRDTLPDNLSLAQACAWTGLPDAVLQNAATCARLKIPSACKNQQFSRLALSAWLAVNDPALRFALRGLERGAAVRE